MNSTASRVFEFEAVDLRLAPTVPSKSRGFSVSVLWFAGLGFRALGLRIQKPGFILDLGPNLATQTVNNKPQEDSAKARNEHHTHAS